MPRHMSFAMTTQQIKDRSKTVTRRLGWQKLRAGERLWAVEKGMGLAKGEKVVKLALIEVVSVRKEKLEHITQDEIVKEGFPEMGWWEFVRMFREANKVRSDVEVQRIEFRYLQGPPEVKA